MSVDTIVNKERMETVSLESFQNNYPDGVAEAVMRWQSKQTGEETKSERTLESLVKEYFDPNVPTHTYDEEEMGRLRSVYATDLVFSHIPTHLLQEALENENASKRKRK